MCNGCLQSSLVNIFYILKLYASVTYFYLDAERVLPSKEMVWSLIWCLLLQKLATWFLDELGLIHQERWSWQIWLQGTKWCCIFNHVAGLGMATFSCHQMFSSNLLLLAQYFCYILSNLKIFAFAELVDMKWMGTCIILLTSLRYWWLENGMRLWIIKFVTQRENHFQALSWKRFVIQTFVTVTADFIDYYKYSILRLSSIPLYITMGFIAD